MRISDGALAHGIAWMQSDTQPICGIELPRTISMRKALSLALDLMEAREELKRLRSLRIPVSEPAEPIEPHSFIGEPEGRCDVCGFSARNEIHPSRGA